MQHTDSRLWIHLIWGTKKRDRFFNPEIGQKLFKYMIEKAKSENIPFEKLNIQPEHIHGLINLPTDKIPQLKDINSVLQKTTGWETYPVPALINFDKYSQLHQIHL